jgi:hypothetical protein
MKKQAITLIALAGVAVGATLAYAAPGSKGGGIISSKHDMNAYLSTHGGTPDTDGRVCAFCHTPHHAQGINDNNSVDINYTDAEGNAQKITYTVYSPLWSRNIDANKSFASYQSVTFNPTASGVPYDNLIGPSRLCMTCHDGATGLDAYYGQYFSGGGKVAGDDQINYFGNGHFAVGGDGGLSNDHPVGMRYSDFYQKSGQGVNYELKDPDGPAVFANNKKINDVLFTDGSGSMVGVVTCASCHDVHNGQEVGNTNPPSGRGYFLRASQNNSQFCVVCHAKDQ